MIVVKAMILKHACETDSGLVFVRKGIVHCVVCFKEVAQEHVTPVLTEEGI